MPTVTLETRQDCEDFVRGCTILGTGGGGQKEAGLEILLKELDAGRKPWWIDASEFPDDAWTACPFLMGSIAPLTPETEKKMVLFGATEVKVKDGINRAIKELEEYQGIKIDGLVPIELGGHNTAESVVSGSQMGLKVLDGDYTGRAIPEIEQIAPLLHGKSLMPITSVDKWGDITIIKSSLNAAMAERIGKLIAVAAFGMANMVGMALPGREAKRILVRDTLTQCLQLGRAVREAREAGKDPLQSAASFLGGWVLFKGKVTGKEWSDPGYYVGTHTLEGVDEFAGHTFKVWFKNENHISWLDDKPYVTSPDIIDLVELETAEPKTNNKIEEGDVMAVLGAKAPDQFRTSKGIEVLGPAHFGFSDIKYNPIEDVMSR